MKNPSKKTETLKTKLNKRSFVSATAVSLVALLLCTAFTFSWLTSKIDYLNTVIRMGEFGATVNVYYEDGKLLTSGSTAGDDVVVDNAISQDKNWSAGTVGYRFVEVKNTGTINLNSFMSFDFDLHNFMADNKTVSDSFYLNVSDITSQVKSYTGSGNKLKKYIEDYKKNSALGIAQVGQKFTDATNVKRLGMTIGGGVSYYLLEYCCYDLSSLAYNSDSFLTLGAKIRVQQTDAPVVKNDKGTVTGESKKHTNSNDNATQQIIPTETKAQQVTTEPNTSISPTAPNDSDNTVVATSPVTNSNVTNPNVVETQPPETTQPTAVVPEVSVTVPVVTPETQTTTPVNEWDVVYLDSEKKTCQIATYRGDEKELKLPTELDGARVTAISGYAFLGSKVEKLTIPATVNSIDFTAFDTDTLKEVKFSKTTEIDDVKYTSPFTADDEVIYTADKSVLLKYMAQKNNKVYKVDNNTVAIADKAFCSAKHLKKLDLSGVQSISSTAFSGAEITDYVFHTVEPPVVVATESFGKITLGVNDKDEIQYVSDVTLHIPGVAYDDYKASLGFASYDKANAIKKDSKLGSDNVATELESGIEYTILRNNSEYAGVTYSSDEAKYVAVVTGYEEIPDNGVVKIASSVVYEEDDDSYNCPVVGIADRAFENAKDMKMLVLPNRDVYYTSDAFVGCDNLGLIDYDSVLPFDVSKFDAILEEIKVTSEDEETEE